jgi:acetyltransferase-like isoleucine patch superfamily enzyme
MDIRDQLRSILEDEYGLALRSGPVSLKPRRIGPDAKIGSGVQFGEDVIIYEGVEIGDGAEIGNRVTLRNCRIGERVRIEDNCSIGYGTLTGGFSHKLVGFDQVQPTVIGDGTLVRSGCTIYQSVTVGKECWINHSVLLREHTRVGDHTCIGSMTDSEGYNTVGSHVLVHSQVHLTARMRIEDYVFVAAGTVFANGNPMRYARGGEGQEEGPTIRFGVQIGVNAVVMPRVEIGCETVVGPATVVSRTLPSLVIVMGNPLRILKPVPSEWRMPLEIRRRYYDGAEDPPGGSDLPRTGGNREKE